MPNIGTYATHEMDVDMNLKNPVAFQRSEQRQHYWRGWGGYYYVCTMFLRTEWP
jgi:hypothetical protein